MRKKRRNVLSTGWMKVEKINEMFYRRVGWMWKN